MRPAIPALQNLLEVGWTATEQVQIGDLYTFTLAGGEVLRFSSLQVPITAPLPNTTSPLYTWEVGPGFTRTKTKTQVGTQVDEMDVTIIATADDKVGDFDLTWQQALTIGLFDGAYCELDRVFMSPSGPDNVIGTITWFYGRIGDVVIGRTKIEVKVKSLLDLLSNQMPRRLYQAGCTWVFGKPGCDYDRVLGKNANGFSTGIGRQLITCQALSDQNHIVTLFSPSPTTAYNLGTIIGVTGANAGFTRTITQIAGTSVEFLIPWIYPVVAGTDTFYLLPGCDKTLNTCEFTFLNNNDQGSGENSGPNRFGGFPYIPPPETAA